MSKNSTLLKAERLQYIRKVVEQQGRVTVPELSNHLSVSEATIRRDLEKLDKQGKVLRTHGGAVPAERGLRELPILQRMAEKRAEKQRIGRAAAQMVQEGETIFLGSGSTVLELAHYLPEDLSITVITNSLPVVNEMAPREGVELVVIGGMLRHSEFSMVGHIAEQAVSEFRADRAFLGMYAVDVQQGFTNDYLPEVRTDRKILSIASQVVILADHSKFGRISSVLVAPVMAVDKIITDTQTDHETVERLRAMGIEVEQV